MASYYLIDTHVLIWMAESPGNIPVAATNILSGNNNLLLSYISVWELAIKLKTEKIRLPVSLQSFIDTAVEKHASFPYLPNAIPAFSSP